MVSPINANTIAALQRAGVGSRLGSGPSAATLRGLSNQQLVDLAKNYSAFVGSSSPRTPEEWLASSQAKLNTSIANILNSDAPTSYKMGALGKAPQNGGESKSFSKRLLDVVNKPLSVVTSAIARGADPNRNFFKDVRANITPIDLLNENEQFNKLPVGVRVAIGLGSSLALDPFTYLGGAGVITKLGGAAGISKALATAAITERAVGNAAEAARMSEIAGNLITKGKGGIGGLSNADIAFVGQKIGVPELKGGLYWNVPGTGRIGQRLGVTQEAVQIPLGRPEAVRRVSAAAANTVNRIKLSRPVRYIGDYYGGGEGGLKRAILEADSPEKALALRDRLDSLRIEKGAVALYKTDRANEFQAIKQVIDETGIDPVVVGKAQGGNTEAIRELQERAPGLLDEVLAFDAKWKPRSLEIGSSQLESFGIDPNEMQALYRGDVDLHQTAVLTEEAKSGIYNGRRVEGAEVGPEMRRNIAYGQDYMGKTMLHPSEPITRLEWVNPNGKTEVIGVGVGRNAQGLRDAETAAGLSRIANNPNVQEPMVRFKVVNKKGKEKWVTAKASEIKKRTFSPQRQGLSVREQANALYKKKYGFDLFDFDYLAGQSRALDDYATLHGKQIRAAYLRSRPTGNAEFDTILQDYPKSVKRAQARLSKSIDNLYQAVAAKQVAAQGRVLVQAGMVDELRLMNQRIASKIKELQTQLAKAPKKGPKTLAIESQLTELRNQHATLTGQIETLTDRINSGLVNVENIQQEISRIQGKAAPAVAPVAAPSAAPPVSAAAVVAPAAAATVDPAIAQQLKLLESEVRDAQYFVDNLRVEPNAPEEAIVAAQQNLAERTKALEDFKAANAVVEPTGAQPVAAAPEPPVAATPEPAAAPEPVTATTAAPAAPLGPPKARGWLDTGNGKGRFIEFEYPKTEAQKIKAIGGRIKGEEAVATAKADLDETKQLLSEARIRREQELSANPRLTGKGEVVRKLESQVAAAERNLAKKQEALIRYKEKNPYSLMSDRRSQPPAYTPAAVVDTRTRQEILADLPADKAAALEETASLMRVPEERFAEFASRQAEYDNALSVYKTLVEIDARPEQIAAAERSVSLAGQSLNDVTYGSLKANLEKVGYVPARPQVEPPKGGYSADWEKAVSQYVDDSIAVKTEIEVTAVKRSSELRKELKAINRANKAGVASPKVARREWAVVDDEMSAVYKVEQMVADVETSAVKAANAAADEAEAWGKVEAALEEATAKSKNYPKAFEPNPMSDPAYQARYADYKMKAAATAEAAVRAEQTAIAARFAASTEGLSSSQAQRILDAVDRSDVHTAIRQVSREMGLPAAVRKAIEPAINAVKHDPQAVAAITANATDPAVVRTVQRASAQKTVAAQQLGTTVGQASSTPQVKKLSAAAQKKIATLRKQAASAKGQVTKMSKSRVDLMDDLAVKDAAIDVLSRKLETLEKSRMTRIANGPQRAWKDLGAAAKESADMEERAAAAVRYALEGESNAALLADRALDDAEYMKFLYSKQGQDAFRNVVNKGFKSISISSQTPSGIADAVAFLTRVNSPDAVPKFVKYFDKLTSIFKSWAVATPGFIARNGYSAAFMNYLFDVSPKRLSTFIRTDRAFRSAVGKGMAVEEAFAMLAKRFGDGVAQQYRLVHNTGVLELGGQVENLLVDLRRAASGDKRDILTKIADTPINRFTYNANREMERMMRGAAAMDAAAKGRGAEGIFDLVFKAHFDYSDLNNFETMYMRRISPFYTWFRKNLPTQMEMIFRNPKAYARVAQAQDTIEGVSDPEDIVPSWMADRLSIRLPWQIPGGQMYVMPELPIRDLNALGNRNELLGMINPIIKTPVELVMNQKLYFGRSSPFQEFVRVPDVYEKTGLGNAMEMLGFARKNENGELVAQDRHLYVLEQFFPFLGRARRLLPNEPRYQDRLPVTVVNTIFGLGLRANTTSDISGEIKRRQEDVDKMAEQLQSLGWGGYDYWKKQVALAWKPTTEKRPYLTLLEPKGGLGFSSPFTNVSSNKVDWASVLQGVTQ